MNTQIVGYKWGFPMQRMFFHRRPRNMKKFLAIIIALILASCNRIGGSSKASGWSASPPPAQRDQLTAAELLAAKTQRTEPVPNAYLSPVGTSAPALHTLEGMLSVPEFRMIYTPLR